MGATDEDFQEALASLEEAIKDVKKVWQLVKDGKIKADNYMLCNGLALAKSCNGIPAGLIKNLERKERGL